MGVSIADLSQDLGKVVDKIKLDGLRVDAVAHIGNSATEDLGMFFSERFDCPSLPLDSPNREGRIRLFTSFINKAYFHLPTWALEAIAEKHRNLHKKARYYCDPLSESEILPFGESPSILLVDDNVYTGKTLELWKTKLYNVGSSRVTTFAITATGDYLPDYYCTTDWISFSWRPIGV